MPNKTQSKQIKEMTLDDLLVIKLKALYDIEQQLVKALPKMAKKASDEDLRRGFERHTKQTQEHVSRLERAFAELEIKPQKLACEGVRGIIADAEWGMKNIKGDAALDAALVAAGQYAEHYEIAGYESAIAWAQLLDLGEIADLLQETLDEERETSDELTELAHAKIDEAAMGAEDSEEGDDDEEDDEKELEAAE
jgi:ferritin-like metal-binding protein YciE